MLTQSVKEKIMPGRSLRQSDEKISGSERKRLNEILKQR